MSEKNFRFSWMQATALVGLLGITGCQEPQVMNKRAYVPPAERDPNFITQPEENFPVDQATQKGTGKKHIDAIFALPPMEDMSSTPVSGPDQSAAMDKPAAGGTYTVVSGDSLGKIAYRNKISVSKLAAANNIAPTAMIRIGQKLIIPGTSGVVTSEPKSTKTKSAEKSTDSAASVAATPGADGLHTVKSGDSISRIAQKYKVKRADLLSANKINENTVLRIGQKLVIPGASVSASANKSTTGTTVKSTTNTTDNVDAQLDELTRELDQSAAASAAAPTAPPQQESVSGQPVEISADITVDAFAKQYNVSVEDLKKANQIPSDNVLKAQTVVFLP